MKSKAKDNMQQVTIAVLIFVIILGLIIIVIYYYMGGSMQEQVANACCEQKGGAPVVYSGCHESFFVSCENAHKGGWYCVLEGSDINYTEVFNGCEVNLVNG